MKFTPYTTKPGDRWDTISVAMYGTSYLASGIMLANSDVVMEGELPGGLQLMIPIIADEATGEDMPPWKTGEGETDPDPGTVDPTIPTIPGGVQPLEFYPGFPRVVGNKIEFAITKTGPYPYVVKKTTGETVAQSSSWGFSAGYPISTDEIALGGLYTVQVGDVVSAQLAVTGTTVPLSFSKVPTFVLAGATKTIRYAINSTGTYRVRLRRISTNTVISDTNVAHTKDVDKVITVADEDDYEVEVGPIKGTVAVYTTNDFMVELGITNDVNSHAVSMWTKSTAMLDMKVVASDGTPFNCITEPNAPFSQDQWIPGTTEWAGDWDQIFRCNPVASGSGGLIPGKEYKFSFRRKGMHTPVYEKLFVIPTVNNITPPLDIPLTEGSAGVACAYGPQVFGIYSFSKDMISWNMDGEGVEVLTTYIKRESDDEIVHTKDVSFVKIVDGVKVAAFAPSWRGYVEFDDELAPGIYRLGTEGKSCDSPIYWSAETFEIEEEGGTDPGPDPGEQLGDYLVKYVTKAYPADMKLQLVATTNGYLVTDLVTSVPASGHRVVYCINEYQFVEVGRLINHLWEIPGPFSIRKIKLRNDLSALYMTGGAQAGDTVVGIDTFGYNGSYAQYDIILVKQNL